MTDTQTAFVLVPRAIYRHKKRGSEYELIGIGMMQAGDWHDMSANPHDFQSVDMREVAIYRSVTDPAEIWVRPREEFADGRFELSAAPKPPESEIGPVAWACLHCNSPRAVDPCQKCGTPLQKPADGWHWPSLPDVDRIRALAKEVGYAVGVHGSLERDLDLMACPWTEGAVPPMALAEHIAAGMNGRVLDYERQDKPLGRWACNIAVDGWFKLIDLSVSPRIDADAAIIAALRAEVESAEARVWKAATDMVAYIGANWPQDIKSEPERSALALLAAEIVSEFRTASPGDYLDEEWKGAEQAIAAERRAEAAEARVKELEAALANKETDK